MILHRYIARRFLLAFMTIASLLCIILFFLDLIETLNRLSGHQASFSHIILLSALNTPKAFYEIIPLITILASLSFFLGLSKSSELVITRAVGRSALVTLLSPILVIWGVGLVSITVLNPIVASTSRAYELQINHIQGHDGALALSSQGLWLRQAFGQTYTIIHASSASLDGTKLKDVTFTTFNDELIPQKKITATSAQLQTGAWHLDQAQIWPLTIQGSSPQSKAPIANLQIASNLTLNHIKNSFADPSSISIWNLSPFIERLQSAGLSASRHQMWLYGQLALPLFLSSIVLIGASFTLRHYRSGGTGLMVLYAILVSFIFYFIRNFSHILGETGRIPLEFAAFCAPFAAIAFSLSLLLHQEDG